MQLYEWGAKNIKGIFFFYVSSETVCENSLKYDLDNRYSLANIVDGTRLHHSFIPTSFSSNEMRQVLSDKIFSNVSFGATSGDVSEFQPGKYVACLYNDIWYIGTIVQCSSGNSNVKVKFMKRDQLCLSWYNHNNKCWVPYQHILYSIKVPQVQGRSGRQYSLDKNDYTKIASVPPKHVR